MEKELEACLSTPDRVGSIFIRYVSARAFFGTSLCSFVLKFCVSVFFLFFFFPSFFCSSSLFLHPPTLGGKGGLGRGEGVKFICHNQFSCVTFAVVYASPAGLHHRTHNSIVLGHNN